MTTKEKIALSKGGLFILTAAWFVAAGLFGTVGFGIAADAAGLTLVLIVSVLNLIALVLLFFHPLAAAIMVAVGLIASIVFLFVHFTDGAGTLIEIAVVLAAFAALVLFAGVLAQRFARA